jgi:hypothetical protein
VKTVFFLSFLAASAAALTLANDVEGDLMKLQADLQNLEADLSSLPADALNSTQRAQVDRIREEAIYLKVKAEKHEGTSAISEDEIRDLRLAISDLRNELRPQILAEAPAETSLTLASGTELDLRLEDSLTSETANVGDRFEAVVAAPVLKGDRVVVDAGTRFRGRVELVDQAGRGTDRTARLVLGIDQVEIGGKTHEVKGTIVGASEDLKTGIGSEVKKIGIGAGLGTVLGAVLGGKKGAVIGATVGGAGVILGTEGKEVELPRGTILKLRLDRDLTLGTT